MTSRRLPATFVAGIIAVALATTTLRAQSAQPFSLQASLLAASQKIGTKSVSGVGFEGQLRYTPAALWSVGLGFQYSGHPSGDDEIKIAGVFLEPRYAIDIGSDRIAPYVALRLAYLQQTLTLAQFADDEFKSNGSAFGAGAGFLIRATGSVNFDVGAAFVRQSFGDATTGNNTATFPGFTGYVAKAGFSIGFGTR